jgi:hypothetical protein
MIAYGVRCAIGDDRAEDNRRERLMPLPAKAWIGRWLHGKILHLQVIV